MISPTAPLGPTAAALIPVATVSGFVVALPAGPPANNSLLLEPPAEGAVTPISKG